LETVLSKGSQNSRMKDFHDLPLLLLSTSLPSSKKLHESMKKTLDNRGTSLTAINFDEAGLKDLQQL
jgi:hypothetical protein